MNIDKSQITNMTSRQKAIAGIIILVVIIFIWIMISMFKGGKKPAQPVPSVPSKNVMNGNVPSPGGTTGTQPGVPQPAQLSQQPLSLKQQSDLIQLQQETQEKYIAALNELQMLRLNQQIADANKQIAAAKYDTVKSEKDIIDLLTKPAPSVETPASFSPSLVNPTAAGAPAVMTSPPGVIMPAGRVPMIEAAQPEVNYVVISVTELLHRWSAVVGYQGKLYNVFVGDVLPPDQSIVISIDRYGIILEKNGIRRKVSLVPII